jgi:hypothetical protein
VTNADGLVTLSVYSVGVALQSSTLKRSGGGNPRAQVNVSYSAGLPASPVALSAVFPLALPVYRPFYNLLRGEITSALVELPLLIDISESILLLNISLSGLQYIDSSNNIQGDVYINICNTSLSSPGPSDGTTLEFLRTATTASCPGVLVSQGTTILVGQQTDELESAIAQAIQETTAAPVKRQLLSISAANAAVVSIAAAVAAAAAALFA